MGNGKEDAKTGHHARTCFLMLEPRGLCNSGEMAKRIARLKGVREVHLTSGRYGFVVSASVETAVELNRIRSAVKRTAGGKSVNVALSHLIYRDHGTTKGR